MAASNINRVILTGNLTRDPELRHLQSGTAVCKLRLAVNSRRKDNTGQWIDKPNYFDVTVWGAQGENCANYLGRGRPVAIDGRLDWREWEDKDNNKRQTVEIIADSVQFLGSRDGAPGGGQPQGAPANQGDSFGGGDPGFGGGDSGFGGSDVPVDNSDFGAAGGAEDDIPF